MPIFESDYGYSDYLTQQDAHYIGARAVGMRDTLRAQPSGSTPPPPPPKDKRFNSGAAAAAQAAGARLGGTRANQASSYPAIPVQRKPVGVADSSVAQQAPQGINRKPVGERPVPITIPSTQSLQQPPRTQPPSGQIRTIYSGADGKYDTNTITTVPSSRFTPPASPSAPTHDRTSSRTSFRSFGKKSRADNRHSAITNNSRPSNSRRGSLQDMFKAVGRRVSDAFKDTATIVKMAPTEREDWIEDRRKDKQRSASQRSDEWEDFHRSHPAERPSYQKDALVSKNKHNSELAHDHSSTDYNYDAMIAQSRHHAKVNKAHRKSYDIACQLAEFEGKPPPKRPADLPIADLSLSPTERKSARDNTHDKHIDELANVGRVSPPHFSAGEKAAIALSKATDTFKGTRGRSNTADSDMSFIGMTDSAPAEAMHICIRCKRPPIDFLHSSGVCNTCFIYEREQDAKYAKMKKGKC